MSEPSTEKQEPKFGIPGDGVTEGVETDYLEDPEEVTEERKPDLLPDDPQQREDLEHPDVSPAFADDGDEEGNLSQLSDTESTRSPPIENIIIILEAEEGDKETVSAKDLADLDDKDNVAEPDDLLRGSSSDSSSDDEVWEGKRRNRWWHEEDPDTDTIKRQKILGTPNLTKQFS